MDCPVNELAALPSGCFKHYRCAPIVNMRPGISRNQLSIHFNRAAVPGTGIKCQSKVWTSRAIERSRRGYLEMATCAVFARAAGIGYLHTYAPIARQRCSPVDVCVPITTRVQSASNNCPVISRSRPGIWYTPGPGPAGADIPQTTIAYRDGAARRRGHCHCFLAGARAPGDSVAHRHGVGRGLSRRYRDRLRGSSSGP